MEFYNRYDAKQGEEKEEKIETQNLQAVLLISKQNQFEIKQQFHDREMKQNIILQKQFGENDHKNYFSAFLGILTILDQKFLLMVKDVQYIVSIQEHEIFKIENLAFIPYEFDAEETDKNKTIYESIEEIRKLFKLGFYFSYTYDLTNTCANSEKNTNEDFLWNHNMFQELLDLGIHIGWRVPVIQGMVKGFNSYLNGKKLQLILISRRSRKRAGTRYNARGLDDEGNVANFCETEQIFIYNEFLCSHVQIRGSVPIFWEQVGIQTSTRITREFEINFENFLKHYRYLKKNYQNIISVNLMSQYKSGEQMITSEYEKVIKHQNFKNYKYAYFDFHHECKNDKFDKVNPLIERLKPHLLNFGFYFYDIKKKQVITTQKGHFRTNCLDCLDRTNYVITKLSAVILQKQMEILGIDFQENFSSDNILDQLDMGASQCHSFFSRYKEYWADNGDFISQHYTGTGSTHTNITRTGKRDFLGLIDHGIKSIGRFYIQNFEDNYKQLGIDIILGEHSDTMQAMQNTLIENFVNYSEISTFIATWNMNSFLPPKEFNLRDKLFDFNDNQLPDLIIIGLQEIGSKSNALDHWYELIQQNLNQFDKSYIGIHKNQDQQLATIIFSQTDLRKRITKIKYDWVKFYYVNNRGAQIVRLFVDDTDISFINADLEKQGFQYREQGVQDIINNAFQIARVGKRKFLKITCSDFRFLFGQLNFDLQINQDDLDDLIQKLYQNDQESIQDIIQQIYQYDELKLQKNQGIFKQFQEMDINFAPTSKFEKFSTLYEKKSIGWNERIMISSNKDNWQQIFYDTKDYIDSKHRPVRAYYRIKCKKIDQDKRQGYYLESDQHIHTEDNQNSIEQI